MMNNSVDKKKKWGNRLATKLGNAMLDVSTGIIMSLHPEWIARNRSNDILRKLCPHFKGDVLNLSAWKDSDKQGDFYRNYFTNASSYTISNQQAELGSSGFEEKELDLSVPYDGNIGTYDVVFTHTVIEHVFPSDIVFDNLANISRDIILTVVPFFQPMHGVQDVYTDYYRYSPLALNQEFLKRGFETLYVSWNEDHPLSNVYIIHVASKHPERHSGLPKGKTVEIGTTAPGILFTELLWPHAESASVWRKMGDFIGRTLCNR